MRIERTEQPTGGPNRTPRETIVPLLTGSRKGEPEFFVDFSGSQAWPWDAVPGVCTWDVQIEAIRQAIVPFESMDSQAAEEQAGGSDEKGGVYCYPFHNFFLPIGDGKDDGDLNSANFDRKMQAFLRKYGDNGKPQGGTEIMTAVQASDEHFLEEFADDPRGTRPVRIRVAWTDGILNDAKKFTRYLEQATLSPEGYGTHGEWDEVWAVPIIGEGVNADGDNPGKDAYQQYAALAESHAWIHPYYFERVVNPAEVAEDMAVATVPGQA